jgi:hypothetical protein
MQLSAVHPDDPPPGPEIKDNTYGTGRLDAFAALQFVIENFGATFPVTFTIPAGETWNIGDVTLRFAEDAYLDVEGTLVANGTRFTEATEDDGWGGIRLLEGSATLTYGEVEHADIGVTVYDPAWLHTDGSTFRHNRVGIDVLSPLNTGNQNLIDNTDLFENGTAVRSDFSTCVGTTCSCLTSCRSRFTVENSCLSSSIFDLPNGFDGRGLSVRNADAYVVQSTATSNNAHGVWGDAAEIRLRNVLLTWNGAGTSPGSDGAHALEGTDLLLFDPFDVDGTGGNVLHHNAGDEIEGEPNAYVLVGLALGGEGPPYNTITKEDAPGDDHRYVLNFTLEKVFAEDVWWGFSTGAPAGAFDPTAYPVSASPYRSSPPGGTPGDPDCPIPGESFGGPTAPAFLATRASSGATSLVRGLDETVGLRIRTLREFVESSAASPAAVEAARELYALQRLDRNDSLGERAETMALIGQVRLRLLDPDLTEAERSLAEVAALAEVDEALRGGDYARAAALVAWSVGRVFQSRTQYRLALAQVTLDEQARRFDSALARLAALLATLPPEATETRRSLASRRAIIAERAGRAASGVAPEGMAMAALGGEHLAPLAFALGVPTPNPSGSTTSLSLDLPSAARVRAEVYDLLGRRVFSVTDEEMDAGRHSLTVTSAALASGTYVVRVEATNASERHAFTRRFTVAH